MPLSPVLSALSDCVPRMASVHFPVKTSTLSGGSDPFSRLAVIPYVSQTSPPGTTSTTSPGSFHIISSLCTTFPFSPPVIAKVFTKLFHSCTIALRVS